MINENGMKKITRLLYLINCISVRHGVSVADLAEKCGVCERTVYRDIHDIFQAGSPIYYDGGYRILKSSAIPPGIFSYDDLWALKDIFEKAREDYCQVDPDILCAIMAKIDRAIAEFPAATAPSRRLEVKR